MWSTVSAEPPLHVSPLPTALLAVTPLVSLGGTRLWELAIAPEPYQSRPFHQPETAVPAGCPNKSRRGSLPLPSLSPTSADNHAHPSPDAGNRLGQARDTLSFPSVLPLPRVTPIPPFPSFPLPLYTQTVSASPQLQLQGRPGEPQEAGCDQAALFGQDAFPAPQTSTGSWGSEKRIFQGSHNDRAKTRTQSPSSFICLLRDA